MMFFPQLLGISSGENKLLHSGPAYEIPFGASGPPLWEQSAGLGEPLGSFHVLTRIIVKNHRVGRHPEGPSQTHSQTYSNIKTAKTSVCSKKNSKHRLLKRHWGFLSTHIELNVDFKKAKRQRKRSNFHGLTQLLTQCSWYWRIYHWIMLNSFWEYRRQMSEGIQHSLAIVVLLFLYCNTDYLLAMNLAFLKRKTNKASVFCPT